MPPRKKSASQKSSKNKETIGSLTEGIRDALTQVFGFKTLTHAQRVALPVILSGKDCLVLARTGGGKTLSYLIPIVHRIITTQNDNVDGVLDVRAVVLSPTRELASQIVIEARKLTTFFKDSVMVEEAIGGIRSAVGDRDAFARIAAKPAKRIILVGTPGRLCDHVFNTGVLAASLLGPRLGSFVLDEADRLLDPGFMHDVLRLANATSKSPRVQRVLVSATMPRSLLNGTVKTTMLAADAVMINAIPQENGDDNDASLSAPRINTQVKHTVITTSTSNMLDTLAWVLQRHVLRSKTQSAPNSDGAKVVVFLQTARQTAAVAAFFRRVRQHEPLQNLEILELHSRLAQNKRDAVSGAFRSAPPNALVALFTSDVSARGVDYPGVTLVVQMGTTTREDYVHRLGRTGRAGRSGSGVLVLGRFESDATLNSIRDLGIEEDEHTETFCKPHATVRRVASERYPELTAAATSAYAPWLGFYSSRVRALRLSGGKTQLVQEAHATFVDGMGLPQVPALHLKLARKMGLDDVPGISIDR